MDSKSFNHGSHGSTRIKDQCEFVSDTMENYGDWLPAGTAGTDEDKGDWLPARKARVITSADGFGPGACPLCPCHGQRDGRRQGSSLFFQSSFFNLSSFPSSQRVRLRPKAPRCDRWLNRRFRDDRTARAGAGLDGQSSALVSDAGHETVTIVPSGNDCPPSRITTPFWTRPRISMAEFSKDHRLEHAIHRLFRRGGHPRSPR